MPGEALSLSKGCIASLQVLAGFYQVWMTEKKQIHGIRTDSFREAMTP